MRAILISICAYTLPSQTCPRQSMSVWECQRPLVLHTARIQRLISTILNVKDARPDCFCWSSAVRATISCAGRFFLLYFQTQVDNQVKIIGSIRQELLSGYSQKSRYDKIRQKLSYFPNEPILDIDYECAAEYSNICRTNGVQGSHIDFLICAIAARTKFKIFTTDKDFKHYSKYLPILLLEKS